jgi:hypothetical protein
MSLLHWILKKRLLRKWRKARHKTIRLKVSDVPGMLEDMDKKGIRYVVLRWPEEVPVTAEQERLFSEDVDLLTDVDKRTLPVMADIVASRPGNVTCDLYSIGGRAGTSYLGMPYYPPVLAENVLENRHRHPKGFYVPQPLLVFRSLAFHVVYHKGLLSGIPTGCEIQTESCPKRNYKQRLEELGKSLNVEIEPPYSLLKLHDYLKQCKWNMPYDLLERYPRKGPWHEYLLHRELNLLRPWAQRLPGLLVFFIRQDATSPEKLDFITSQLSGKFHILRTEILSDEQIERVVRFVRGGNWIQGPNLELVRPVIAMITYDHNPVPVDESDHLKKTSYPLVRNGNVFIKQHIREMLNSKFFTDGEIFGIHGSDNEFEAQHMLRAIYDQRVDEVNNMLVAGLKKP